MSKVHVTTKIKKDTNQLNMVKEIATHIESDHYYETKAMNNVSKQKGSGGNMDMMLQCRNA